MKDQLKETVEYLKLQVGLAVTYAREGLEKLEEHPWFPRRKVIAGGLSAFAASFVSQKLHLDVDAGIQAFFDGGTGLFVAWLIPEAPDKK